jgi:hypothetical protein
MTFPRRGRWELTPSLRRRFVRQFTSRVGLSYFQFRRPERLRARGVSDACFRLDHGRDYGRLRRLLGCCIPSQLGPVYQIEFDVTSGAGRGTLRVACATNTLQSRDRQGAVLPRLIAPALRRAPSRPLIYTILKYRPQPRECRIS